MGKLVGLRLRQDARGANRRCGPCPTHARRRPARTAQQHPQSLSCADDRAMPHARTLTASSTRADWAGMVILLVTSLLIGSKLVAHLQAREGGQLY